MRSIRAAALLVAAVSTAAVIVSTAGGASRATLVVGAVHVGSVTDAGYNQAQHAGLIYLKQHVKGITLREASHIPEGPQVTSTMQNMINSGAKLIFPQSFGYQDFALDLAGSNPAVKFEHPAGYKWAPNFGTYWAASTPINYAAGVAAGLMSKTHKIGFIGAIPIPTIIATADAFHLGARSVKPTTTTRVIFTGSWSDPAKEAAAVKTLKSQGVDVIATLVDTPITVAKTAQAQHVYVIGYHSGAAQKYAPKYWLTGVSFNWGPMFVQMANQVMNGTWKAKSWIAPVKMGIAKLALFGPNVPMSIREKAKAVQSQFASGKLKSAFKGPVYDQAGHLMVKKGVNPPASFEQSISWLAKGMIGKAN